MESPSKRIMLAYYEAKDVVERNDNTNTTCEAGFLKTEGGNIYSVQIRLTQDTCEWIDKPSPERMIANFLDFNKSK